MKLLISSVCIVLSFFVGYSFAEEKNKKIREEFLSQEDFVNVSIKKNKLKVNTSNNAIEVLINGETLNTEMTLENICY
jgi:hypothetical protein